MIPSLCARLDGSPSAVHGVYLGRDKALLRIKILMPSTAIDVANHYGGLTVFSMTH